MPKHPLAEVFGFPINNESAEAHRYRQNRLCPFNNKIPNCTKDKARNPLGVCTVFDGDNLAVTCPVRFREDWLIAEDAAAFFFPAGTEAAQVKAVQRGLLEFSRGDSVLTATLDAVVPSQSIVLIHQSVTENSPGESLFTCELTSPTVLTVERQLTGSAATVDWQVIEFSSGVTVQRGEARFTSGERNRTVSFTNPVDLSKAFPLVYVRSPLESFSADEQTTLRAELAETTLSLERREEGSALTVHWQVVEFEDGASVQHGLTVLESGHSSGEQPLAQPVDVNRSFLF